MALTKVTSGLISADASSVDLNIDAGTLYIDATNNRVGIGTSSPSAELSVSNNGVEGYEISPATVIGGTIRQLAFNRSTSAYIPMRIQASEHQFYISGSEKVRIDSSGNVGIGTASPTEKLEVIGDIQTYQLKTLKNYVFGADNYHIKLGEGDGDGFIGNVNAATYISSAGYYYGASQYQLTGGSTGGGVMYLQADGTIRFLNQATTTADSLITPSERMRIDSTGNVRIGATTGFHKVCIAHDDSFTDIASGYANLELSNPNGTNDTYSRIVFNDAAGGPGSGILGVKLTDTTNNYGQFEFWTRSSSGGSTKMVIDPNGNVGIGTSSPDVNLHVANAGDAYLKVNNTSASKNAQIIVGGSGARLRSDDALIFDTGSSPAERMRIDSSGNLLHSTTDSNLADNTSGGGTVLQNGGGFQSAYTGNVGVLNRMGSDGSTLEFRNRAVVVGSVSTTSSSTTYNTSSDARLKEVTGSARGLEVINALNPVSYNWKADGKADEGLIAQEVLEIVPNAVSGSEEEYYQMDYSKLVTHLVAGMKEQQVLIEQLQAEVALLKGE